jgi:hypothetical protein
MNYNLIFLLILAIPALAIIDVAVFGKHFERVYQRKVVWQDFIVPCALETFCFIAGYILGSGGV